MKYTPALLLLPLLLFICRFTFAGPGDTTTVQTFTFNSPLEGKFLFPDSTHRWEKILMYYTLKCNPKQSPACGEWDYLTYTYLWKHTGVFDSTAYTHSNFMVNGSTPDTFMYMNTPSWSYSPWFEYFNETIPVSTGTVGDGTLQTGHFLSGSATDSRSQILWKKEELLNAGISAGMITGMRFNIFSAGTPLRKLTIRLLQVTNISLSDTFIAGNFTTVFRRDHVFSSGGWNVIPFAYPFMWDGSSDIIADISYEDKNSSAPTILMADESGFSSVLYSDKPDFSLKFCDNDFVKVPCEGFGSIDSAITVAFWCYGDPLKQPQNNTLFEGIDSAGRRVVNVHLPWSDGKVYWDAGRDSAGYDRLYQGMDPEMYRGKWNHWTFVKDAVSGRMKIYFNGELIRILAGKHKRMNGIKTFRIGSEGTGNDLFYDGLIDDFSVWNKALSDSAVRQFMYRDISSSHPDLPHLVVWYKFDENNGFTAADSSGHSANGLIRGYPEHWSYRGISRFRNTEQASVRPQVVFEQGVYDPAGLDSILKIDTLPKAPVMIVIFGDTIHPYLATDTLTRWPVYYAGYTYDSAGHPVDSVFVPNDGVMYRKDHSYYGEPFEVLERYELARYITPYGNNLSLGEGWTWIYDLTDYAPLLRDSVHLSAGNWQELLDMKFRMIEGVPPRDVKDIKNIYTGGHGYANADQHNLPPVKVRIADDVSEARLKMRITGHGFGGNLDCSEFCPRTNKLFLNGTQAFTHYVWRQCGINPLYPQGGTWLYDRANWCPGAEVSTKNFEITPYIIPGDSISIDYDLQAYTWNGQGSWPYYQIESQLITYGPPNFSLDASMEEIIAPNEIKNYNRFNPLCGSPVIAIKNNGSTALTTVDISYGPTGGKMQTYHWAGNLPFQDTAVVTLPPIDWTGWDGAGRTFIFTLLSPNGGQDQYLSNNTMKSSFVLPPVYENSFLFQFKTNHLAPLLSWRIEDQSGNIIRQNGVLDFNTLYVDTISLPTGCYMMTIENQSGEGLSYWANMPPYGNGTAGFARLQDMNGTTFKTFQADFGNFIKQGFTVGMNINVREMNPFGYALVYPNPSDGPVNIEMIFDHPENIDLSIVDAMGKEIFFRKLETIKTETLRADLTGNPPGVYFLRITSGKGEIIRKILLR